MANNPKDRESFDFVSGVAATLSIGIGVHDHAQLAIQNDVFFQGFLAPELLMVPVLVAI